MYESMYGNGHSMTRCPGPNCLTFIPDDRDLCHFCQRTVELVAEGRSKECLRCRRYLPLTDFAGSGRFRLCDLCRDTYPMTDEERRLSHRMSPYYDVRRRRMAYRERRAA